MGSAPRIAFYGDDCTGSTDALEVLALWGLRTVLFTDVPSPELLARFEGLEAVGIAGNSRGPTPAEIVVHRKGRRHDGQMVGPPSRVFSTPGEAVCRGGDHDERR